MGELKTAEDILTNIDLRNKNIRLGNFQALNEILLEAKILLYTAMDDKENLSLVNQALINSRVSSKLYEKALLDYAFELFFLLLEDQKNEALGFEKQQRQQVEKERKVSVQFWITLTAFLIMFFLFLVVVLFNRANKRKAALETVSINKQLTESLFENEKLKSTQLEYENQLQSQNLIDISMEIRRKRTWLEEYKEKIIKTFEEAEDKIRVKKIIDELNFQLMTEEKQKFQFENIEEINRSFNKKLKTTYPELTNSEIELCGLIRLKLSAKEIVNYRNIQPDSVFIARKRIRKKMKLQKSENLLDVLIEM